MTTFNEEQKRIAMLLMHSSKTAEELNKQLDIPYDKLMQELRDMLKLDVISREGFPTKYKLKDSIVHEVKRRKRISEDDIFKLRLRIIIEAQAVDDVLLNNQLEKLESSLQKDKNFTIYSIEKAEVAKEGDYFSSYLDVNLTVRDFTSLINLMFFYGPGLIEVMKPAKMEFNAQDLQDGLTDMSDMVHKYTEYITKLMSRKELEAFHDKLYRK